MPSRSVCVCVLLCSVQQEHGEEIYSPARARHPHILIAITSFLLTVLKANAFRRDSETLALIYSSCIILCLVYVLREARNGYATLLWPICYVLTISRVGIVIDGVRPWQ
jgi:hypothetical protein